ncbi:probable mitochondrial glutathione transporter SLC25A39 [Solea solea]|uniref:probable mitochondrial glutathione transporter SLC25A39 n=1 Tax=Solea solea TaxID=90069 RepID=UPI00272C3EDF|nr:probable mitochondrial glutathione transporter SLC25A39 [Solea solea]
MAAEQKVAGRSGVAISMVQQMLASGTGAVLASLCVLPLDVVKVRLQTQQTLSHQAVAGASAPSPCAVHPSKWKCFVHRNRLLNHIYVSQNATSCTRWYNTPTHFSGTLDAFVKIIRHEGLASLWSGLPPTLVMAVPATVVYFTCYDQLKDLLTSGLGLQGSHTPLLAGATARLTVATVVCPLELIRTKMQSRRLSYSELRMALRSALAQDGPRCLWRGWSATTLRDVPFSAVYWFNYELVKAHLCERTGEPQASFSISFLAGAISGSIAAFLTMPFDVVKTRRQIQLGDVDIREVFSKNTTALSTWRTMKKIRAELGYRGLFAGLLPRVIRVAPACAIMISTYEFGKSFFQEWNMNRERPAP